MRVERGATVGAALPGIEFPINAATSATQRSTDQIIIKLESNKRKTEIKKKSNPNPNPNRPFGFRLKSLIKRKKETGGTT